MHTKLLAVNDAQGTMQQRSRRTILLLIASQITTVLVIAAVLTVLMGTAAGYSALVGGLVGVLPNYHFAGRMTRERKSAAPEQSLRDIYVGEFIKIAFTAALFVIAIMLLSVNFLVVVMAYFATVVVNWLAFLVADLGEMPGSATPPGSERATAGGE